MDWAGRPLAATVKIALHCVQAACAVASRRPAIALATCLADMGNHLRHSLGYSRRRILGGDPRPGGLQVGRPGLESEQVLEVAARRTDVVRSSVELQEDQVAGPNGVSIIDPN